MDGLELAALHTLQHRLAADAARPGGFEHGNRPGGASTKRGEVVSDADAQRCPRGELCSGDEAVPKLAVYRERHEKAQCVEASEHALISRSTIHSEKQLVKKWISLDEKKGKLVTTILANPATLSGKLKPATGPNSLLPGISSNRLWRSGPAH